VPWALGAGTLGLAKILENMEIGHNVMHGQWDWMNDPVINSKVWDWDTASTAESWRHSHNYIHHTYTNIVGKDKDLGYEIMRIDPSQPWNPVYLLQPFYNVLLAWLLKWGVALHDLDLDAIRKGEKSQKQLLQDLKGIAGKARAQIQKDYIAWPALSGILMTLVELGVFWARQQADERTNNPADRVRRLGRKARRRKEMVGQNVLRELVERRSFREPFRRTLTANVVSNLANVVSNLIRNVWAYDHLLWALP